MDTQGKSSKTGNSKLVISKFSSSSTKSIGVIMRSMLKKLKGSSQMTLLTEYVQKDLGSPSHANEDDEERLASLTKAIEGLTKHVQDQDAQIAKLINKEDNIDTSHIMGKQVEAHDEVEVSINQLYPEKDKSTKECRISSNGLIHVVQLKEFIEETIRSKIVGSSKSILTYSKPCTQRIDNLKMPMGYEPPKFQQFDGKGNPKQLVAHFVETYYNTGTCGDHLVKQFVRSLKGNAFDWYTNLQAGSIDGWEQLKQEFFN
ncbi:UNVERIFIED_CONTAM: hypothetical protein Slati_1398000 [Sesamum latifolium]|uniref:Ty3-gypsy retrotransposon protein n=1 Tax=Sesamum latifolium TaxID=2727402 RepID=A0AAW2X4A0_9LAMI